MKKSISQLKRDANSGKMFVELLERFGKTGTDIPEWLRGKRKVLGSNSVALKIARADDPTKDSKMRMLLRASLVEYDGENLTVFGKGSRPLTPEEQQAVKESRRIPVFDGYRGKILHLGSDGNYCIIDPDVRGRVILRYRVTFS